MSNSKMHEFKFKLGAQVKDSITGYNGIVIRRTQWINGCNTYGVQHVELHEKKILDPESFDEYQLVLIEEDVHKEHRSRGGPPRHVPNPFKGQ